LICSKAPGKIILFGEHFVVKGKPAIVTAINLYAKTFLYQLEDNQHVLFLKQYGKTINLDKPREVPEEFKQYIRIYELIINKYGLLRGFKAVIDSEIPVAAGMGSSASTAVSFTHALLRYSVGDKGFSLEEVNRIAYEAEKIVHGKPSGIDNTVATYGGTIYYKRGKINRLNIKWPNNLAFIVVNSNIKRNTGEVVLRVLERYEKHMEIYKYIYDAAEALVEKAYKLILKNNFEELGELMMINQGLLYSIGVSLPELEEIIGIINKSGALGAKISGAGYGGIVYGITYMNIIQKTISKLIEYGYKPLVVKPVNNGVINC
jgi:mevalonate kinase